MRTLPSDPEREVKPTKECLLGSVRLPEPALRTSPRPRSSRGFRDAVDRQNVGIQQFYLLDEADGVIDGLPRPPCRSTPAWGRGDATRDRAIRAGRSEI
jgi:hypothetical protein